MTTRRIIKYQTALSMLATLLMAMFFASSVLASNYPLEIINIKPAGTGNPPIPPTNRIFRAYPGIEYNIRPAVIGGLYPFAYRLSNEPAGMTINSKTGEIKWTPASEQTTGTITVTVRDSELSQASGSWVIVVEADDFIFVNSNDSGSTEDGTITEPYKSINSLLTNTSAADVNKIVYFRGGSYTWETFNPSASIDMRIGDVGGANSRPYKWIGYSGETVNMDANDIYMRMWDSPIYLDNLNINNGTNHFVIFGGGRNYNVVRRCTFDSIVSNTGSNINQGMLYSTSGTNGSFLVIQDNTFTDFTGCQAIGSLYDGDYVLIENNDISEGGYAGPHSFVSMVGLKHDMNYVTIRGNKFDAPTNSTGTAVELYGGSPGPSSDVDISFNFFINRLTGGNRGLALSFQYVFNVYFYRNTVINDIKFNSVDSANCTANGGPWTIYNNVIINPNTIAFGQFVTFQYYSFAGSDGQDERDCLDDSNDLTGQKSDNIIDNDGNLTAGYSEYINTHGHQIKPEPRALTGLRILVE